MELKLNDFAIVREETNGDVIVSENTQFNNIKADSVVIEENVKARLFGNVKSLLLKKGACVYVHGSIEGKIESHEGELHIFQN
jgi:hypothetical protein